MPDQRLAPSSWLDSIETDCLDPRAHGLKASRVGHHGAQTDTSTDLFHVCILNRVRAARSRGSVMRHRQIFGTRARQAARSLFNRLGARARETTRGVG